MTRSTRAGAKTGAIAAQQAGLLHLTGADRVRSNSGLSDAARLDIAVNELGRTHSDMSAQHLTTHPQRLAMIIVAATALAILFVAPGLAIYAATAILALPFTFIALLRLAALWQLARSDAPVAFSSEVVPAPSQSEPDEATYAASGICGASEACGTQKCLTEKSGAAGDRPWPDYTLLVPLYREARVAAKLIDALALFDYPIDRLQILLITEADDEATRAALCAAQPAPHMQIITVPAGLPRTKPRALNYALTFATGDIVAVYDAEDVPHPAQLKMAARAFQASTEKLGCVQARLDIYNPRDTFYTRQFTLEYAALFFAMLPAYERLGLPLPLGGTSNHFSRDVLQITGGWDAFNVTEDADLGLRLARLGYKVSVIPSDTWEEAPATFAQWFGQRTRWIKGWMQTYLVHMRDPARTLKELGALPFLGFQMIFGGLILSALVHPIFYTMLGYHLATSGSLVMAQTGWPAAMWIVCALNIVISYVSAIILCAWCAHRREKGWLARSAFAVPIYWLMISAAAYVALFELIRRPHHWAKTAHTGAGRKSLDEHTQMAPNAPCHSECVQDAL